MESSHNILLNNYFSKQLHINFFSFIKESNNMIILNDNGKPIINLHVIIYVMAING